MRHYLINNNSENLLIFFTGWGCDEYEFAHLTADSDLLLLFDYQDLNLDFDFSKYKKYSLIAFSAGVFVATVFNFDFKIDKKIAVDGNPFLFDEKLGLSKDMQYLLYTITEKTADDFAKNYLVKPDEFQIFHHSKRSLESCRFEFDSLRQLYNDNKQSINDFYDYAIIGDDDLIFNVSVQKEYFGDRLVVLKNARHNPFFRIKKYEQILNLDII